MSRNPGPGRCVHCLAVVDKRNWDHVFPRSWYPDSTPSNLHKWQIPSCVPCNDDHGRSERDLLVRLALCLDPEASESRGIVERALRSIDPSRAKSEADAQARLAKRQQLLRHMLEGPAIPTHAIFPNFGERWGRPIEAQGAITVSAESLAKLTEKIIRGLHYIERHAFIEPPFVVEFCPMPEASDIDRVLKLHGQQFDRGPGIEVSRVVAPEDNTSSFWKIVVFCRLPLYASVSRIDG